jgi:hypothetical protein
MDAAASTELCFIQRSNDYPRVNFQSIFMTCMKNREVFYKKGKMEFKDMF